MGSLRNTIKGSSWYDVLSNVSLFFRYSFIVCGIRIADASRSHLGHYGVVHWDRDDNFYRIRVIEEFANDAEVRFIDNGNCKQIPRCKILASLESLTCFLNSPFEIHSKMNDVTLSLADWSKLILEKKIRLKIGKCVNEVYSVTLTDDPCRLITKLQSSFLQRFHQNAPAMS